MGLRRKAEMAVNPRKGYLVRTRGISRFFEESPRRGLSLEGGPL